MKKFTLALVLAGWAGLPIAPTFAGDIDPARKQRAVEQTMKSLNVTDAAVVERAGLANALLEVRFEPGSEGRILLVTEKEPQVSVRALPEENKVVVDLHDTVNLLEERSTSGPSGSLISKARSSQFEVLADLTSRVVLDLQGPAQQTYEVLPDGVALTITRLGDSPAVAEPVAASPAQDTVGLKPMAEEEVVTELAETESPAPAPEAPKEEPKQETLAPAESAPLTTLSAPSSTAAQLLTETSSESGTDKDLQEAEQDKIVTISFAKGTSLVEAVNALARVGGLNVVLDPSVEGDVTARLVDVPLKTALRALLVVNGFDFIEKDGVYRVVPLEKTGLEDVETKVLIKKLEYVDVTPLAKTCDEFLTKEYGKLSFDAKSNTLIIKDIPPVVDHIETLLQAVDKRTLQVYVEAAIVDVRVQEDSGFGFSWEGPTGVYGDWSPATIPSNLNPGGFDADAVRLGWMGIEGGGFPAALENASTIAGAFQLITDQFGIGMAFQAMEGSEDAEVLAMPTLLTLDNQSATVSVINKLPYVEYRYDKDTGAPSDVQYKTEDVKILLEVKPHVTQDGQVLMAVRINKDEGEYEAFTIFGSTNTQFPKVTERFVDTNTVIIDGNTLVMGGLRETREEKGVDTIPFLGRIPLLGWLFRSEYIVSQDYELIVFLTPHIIEPEFMITERDRNLYETTTTHADNQTVDPYNRFEPYYDMKHRSQYVSPHGLKTTPGGKSWSVDGPAQWKYW